MNKIEIKKLFMTENRNFSQNDDLVAKAMNLDSLLSVMPDIEYILDHESPKIDVLLYYGDRDYICNWMEGEQMALKLNWKYANKFREELYQNWTANGKVAGKYKLVDNLKFLILKGAGHMVPVDVPYESLRMMQEFMGLK